MNDKILAINPGSTSTKIALHQNGELVLKQTVRHDAAELAQFPEIADQLSFREQTIQAALQAEGIDISDCAAFSGRGGGLQSCEGGVYEVNSTMIEHARSGRYGGKHPAALGCQLAYAYAQKYHARAFVVNGADTDEFCDEARITGFSDVFRASHVHALNQKETALQVAHNMGLEYEKANFVVAHIGGGVSITAHRQGRMVDSNDIINGDGPMAPTRSGALPAKDLMELCLSGNWNRKEMYARLTKQGGFVEHLGTSEVVEVVERIKAGDQYAELIYRAFIYQIAKSIGAMAAVLEGQIDAIILTGGISHDKMLVDELKRKVEFLAPVVVCPGELELEALVAGALRVLRGEEQPKEYTGLPTFSPASLDALRSVGL